MRTSRLSGGEAYFECAVMVGYSMRADKNVSPDKVIKRSVICLLGIAMIRTMSVGVDGPTSGNTTH
jgi:hypothetical protein